MDGNELSAIAHLNPELVHVIGAFVPSNQINYKTDEQGNVLSFLFRKGVTDFKHSLRDELIKQLEDVDMFPTQQEVHVAITFGIPASQYTSGDIDNKSKTILDAMKGPVYLDDCQVQTLWADKKVTEDDEDWCLIAVKIL